MNFEDAFDTVRHPAMDPRRRGAPDVAILDDGSMMNWSYAGMLAPLGLSVRAEASSRAFLEGCYRDPRSAPYCVIADPLSPDRAGMAFLRLWNAHPLLRQLPVIVTPGSKDARFATGSFKVIQKPFSAAIFQPTVLEAVAKGKAAMESWGWSTGTHAAGAVVSPDETSLTCSETVFHGKRTFRVDHLDDEKGNRWCLEVFLKRLGPFKVRGYDRKQPYLDALITGNAEVPDLIVTDLASAGLHGRDFIEALRLHPRTKGIPVVVLSASIGRSEERRFDALSASAWLSKPADLATLTAAIDDALGVVRNRSRICNSEPCAGATVFGRFDLRQTIGRGGMGSVWLAWDRLLEQKVALKFVAPGSAEREADLDRLRLETRQARALTHPSIARVHDFHRDDAGCAISMEYIEGSNLRQLLTARGALDPVHTLRYFQQILDAVEAAHERSSLVHGDLKPENVMISRSDDVKIVDFGLARPVFRASEQRGAFCGTVPYSSPQRLRGIGPTIADDVYALGVVLFEMLTGSTPFSGEGIARRIAEETPPTVSGRRAERRLRGLTIPLAWDQAVARCLAKDPASRPQSCTKLRSALGLATR
jgi:CheY-like chemotaxis protein